MSNLSPTVEAMLKSLKAKDVIREQKKIAKCFSSVDELIALQERKLDALKAHKRGLMQQLFPREGETQPRLCFPESQIAIKLKSQQPTIKDSLTDQTEVPND